MTHRRPLKALLLLVLPPLLLCCGAYGVAALENTDNSAAIELSGEHRYKALRLSPAIYSAANIDLSDLRIRDSRGEYAPYFIHNSRQEILRENETSELSLINSYVQDEHFYFDYTLAQASASDTIATSLVFTSADNNFAKTVDIYGSYDNKNWSFVQEDKLFITDYAEKLYIDLALPQKYTHYRLQLSNNLEQIAFSSAYLVYSAQTAEESYFIASLNPDFQTEEQEKITHITIEGLKNLRLCDITLQTDSLFKRTVSAPGGITKELYNLYINDTALTDLSLPLQGRIAPDDTYTIYIANADDKPINISAITARYYADELVFEAKAGEIYRLEFGADTAKTAPIYDIASYKNEILAGELDLVSLGEIIYATEEEPPPPPANYQLIFNIVIVVIALILGAVILLRFKKAPSSR